MTTTRERLGWAALFGLPVGIGIGLATARMARTGLDEPLVVVSGGMAAALVAAFVFGAASAGQVGDDRPARRRDRR
jgi:hypothetical protein